MANLSKEVEILENAKSDYDVFQQPKNGTSNMTRGLKIAGPVQLLV